MKDISQEIFFRDKIEYGLISIIGLGSVISSHLKKFDLINPDKIIVYESYEDIDYKFFKKLEMNSLISEQLKLTKHCLLSGSNIYSDEVSVLIDRIEEVLDEDTVFYLKDEKSNLKFSVLLLFLSI